MAQKTRPQAETLYGLPQPLQTGLIVPIIAKRDPTSLDTGYPLGQTWDNKVLNTYWVLTSVAAGAANWEELTPNGSGSLGSLTGDTGTATPSAGNIQIAGTAAQITTAASGSTVTLSLPSAITAPGSLSTTTTLHSGTSFSAATTITATLGNITATNGNIVLGTLGNKFIVPTGTNASAGTSGVMSGTPGAVTVATTASSATAKIFYSRATTGGTPGQVSITAQDGTGFTLTSTGNETSTFNWWIINA